jgi:hypothetical protein
MVETVTLVVAVPVAVRDHHTVLVVGFVLGGFSVKTHGGTGSVDSWVAAELSTVFV